MQEATNLLSFGFVHLNHLLCEEGEQIVDDIGTLWIGGEMVFYETHNAVGTPSVEAVLVEVFGFFELAVAFFGRSGEVDTADGYLPNFVWEILPLILSLRLTSNTVIKI